MNARLSKPKRDCKPQSKGDDPALVHVAIQKIQTHYIDQGFALKPASLRAILAMAALLRLAEKKCDGQGAVLAGRCREDAAKAFLQAALAQLGPINASRR
jgi:hypothetical protein